MRSAWLSDDVGYHVHQTRIYIYLYAACCGQTSSRQQYVHVRKLSDAVVRTFNVPITSIRHVLLSGIPVSNDSVSVQQRVQLACIDSLKPTQKLLIWYLISRRDSLQISERLTVCGLHRFPGDHVAVAARERFKMVRNKVMTAALVAVMLVCYVVIAQADDTQNTRKLLQSTATSRSQSTSSASSSGGKSTSTSISRSTASASDGRGGTGQATGVGGAMAEGTGSQGSYAGTSSGSSAEAGAGNGGGYGKGSGSGNAAAGGSGAGASGKAIGGGGGQGCGSG